MTIRATPQSFTVVIEQDSEGWLIGSVPGLPGCHTQARTFEELEERIREAIRVCLDDSRESEPLAFRGVMQVST